MVLSLLEMFINLIFLTIPGEALLFRQMPDDVKCPSLVGSPRFFRLYFF